MDAFTHRRGRSLAPAAVLTLALTLLGAVPAVASSELESRLIAHVDAHNDEALALLDRVLEQEPENAVALLKRGVMLAPSQFEVIFLSTAHDETDVDHIVDAPDHPE